MSVMSLLFKNIFEIIPLSFLKCLQPHYFSLHISKSRFLRMDLIFGKIGSHSELRFIHKIKDHNEKCDFSSKEAVTKGIKPI